MNWPIKSYAINEFYHDRERGWYYHEGLKQEPELKTKKDKPLLKNMPSAKVLELLDNVQKEMKVRQARYVLEPTVETAKEFLEYQQAMFNNGSKASEAMQTALLKYPQLDPRIENPIAEQAIKLKEEQTTKENEHKIVEFAKHFKLYYFFKGSCPYCHQFQPVIERFAAKYGFKIEALSMDGTKLDSINTSSDQALAKRLQVQTTPTVIAYNLQNDIYVPIAHGFLPESDLTKNVVHVYDNIIQLSMGAK
jgi:conjugal transfer pilus assembly protein TraF